MNASLVIGEFQPYSYFLPLKTVSQHRVHTWTRTRWVAPCSSYYSPHSFGQSDQPTIQCCHIPKQNISPNFHSIPTVRWRREKMGNLLLGQRMYIKILPQTSSNYYNFFKYFHNFNKISEKPRVPSIHVYFGIEMRIFFKMEKYDLHHTDFKGLRYYDELSVIDCPFLGAEDLILAWTSLCTHISHPFGPEHTLSKFDGFKKILF